MTDSGCPRCHLPRESPHRDEADCIAALGAAVASMRSELDELRADLAVRREEEQRRRELHAQAEADLARGG